MSGIDTSPGSRVGGGFVGSLMRLKRRLFSGGIYIQSFPIGTISSGTYTVDCGNGPQQFMTNNGAFTLAAPTMDGNCFLNVVNGASAGAITFSGMTVGANTGDALDTTSTHKFTLSIWRINGVSSYFVKALQ